MPVVNEDARRGLSTEIETQLPIELLFIVAESLQWRELLSFAQASKPYSEFASSNYIWHPLFERYFPDANPEMVEAIAQGKPPAYIAPGRESPFIVNSYKAAFKHFHTELMRNIRRNCRALKYASNAVKSDYDIVLAAVKQNGLALEYVSAALKGNAEIVKAAVKQNWLALEYASAALKGNAEIVKAAVKQNGLALRYASAALKGDRDIVMEAVKRNGYALRYASDALKGDYNFVLMALKQNRHLLRHVIPRLRQDVYLNLVATPIIGLAFACPEISLSLCAAGILLLAGASVMTAGAGAVVAGALSYLACNSFLNQRPGRIDEAEPAPQQAGLALA